MQNILSRFSVKRIFSLFTIITICLLLLVLSSAVKQYLLHRQCEMRVVASQQLLFQFTGIKEHINETLISHKELNAQALILELQEVNGKLQNVFDDILIPEEFKINFITQLDLVNITLTLRQIQSVQGEQQEEQIALLSTQLRSIHSKVDTFYQLINRYSQTQLMGLYKALVALLLVIIALLSMMLFIINHHISFPILRYCKSLSSLESDSINLLSLHKTIETLTAQTITAKEEDAHAPASGNQNHLYHYSLVGHLLEGFSHELTNISNGSINYSQAILDLSADTEMDNDTKQLLQKLLLEEKKMSRILITLIRLNGCRERGLGKDVNLDEFFAPVISLSHGSFHNEEIHFEVPSKESWLLPGKYCCDLQLILLDILQSCRTPLVTDQAVISGDSEQKTITVSVAVPSGQEGNFSILITTHAPLSDSGKGQEATSQAPWDSMLFWETFLHTMGGTLVCQTPDDLTTLYTIDIPCDRQPFSS